LVDVLSSSIASWQVKMNPPTVPAIWFLKYLPGCRALLYHSHLFEDRRCQELWVLHTNMHNQHSLFIIMGLLTNGKQTELARVYTISTVWPHHKIISEELP
ncbi:MAG: hypothetical protein ACI8RD_014886, partial [Bacillariaceae sp.]